MLKLAFTCGDINGIGPEIVVKTLNSIYNPAKYEIKFFCPHNVFEKTASIVQPAFDFQLLKKNENVSAGDNVTILDLGRYKQTVGNATADAGIASVDSILEAYYSVKKNRSDAIITAPISKTSLQKAGINFPGHTEMLASLTKTKKYLMTFLSSKLICGLATIHEPVKNISRILSYTRLQNSINILYDMLVRDLLLSNPTLAVLGLNPHAGENGNIGKEELNVIKPAVDSFGTKNIQGPFVPDAFFGAKKYKNYNAVLGMYHDQALIPFKLLNFDKGVNYTAGLPIVRTSPDHGTGYDIAGKGIADPSSMIEAVKWAVKIVNNRKKI